MVLFNLYDQKKLRIVGQIDESSWPNKAMQSPRPPPPPPPVSRPDPIFRELRAKEQSRSRKREPVTLHQMYMVVISPDLQTDLWTS